MLSYEDDINILNSHRNYDNNTEKKICFTYDYSDSRLQTLRLEYKLDCIAGLGSDFMKMLRITYWLSKYLTLGNAISTDNFHALSVLRETQTDYVSNCFITANVLQDCFLSMGYKARMVRCLPLDLRYNECHCITAAYVEQYHKFIIFDAGMGGCYVDSKGTLLSIPEMRELIIYQKTFYIRSIGDIDSKELAKYWAKNLVRFQSHMNIKYGNEMKGEKKVLVTLNPATLVLNDKIDAKNNHDCQYVFTNNDKEFWEMDI